MCWRPVPLGGECHYHGRREHAPVPTPERRPPPQEPAASSASVAATDFPDIVRGCADPTATEASWEPASASRKRAQVPLATDLEHATAKQRLRKRLASASRRSKAQLASEALRRQELASARNYNSLSVAWAGT